MTRSRYARHKLVIATICVRRVSPPRGGHEIDDIVIIDEPGIVGVHGAISWSGLGGPFVIPSLRAGGGG